MVRIFSTATTIYFKADRERRASPTFSLINGILPTYSKREFYFPFLNGLETAILALFLPSDYVPIYFAHLSQSMFCG
jgi:hypothetical protein